MVPSEPTDERSVLLAELAHLLRLADNERRAYEFLLGRGSATPSAVARETGQSRGRIYDILRVLVERGLAREEPTRPIRYVSVPLDEVVRLTLADLERRAVVLEQGARALQPATVTPTDLGARPARAGDVSVFAGRRSVTAETLRLMRQAQREFHFLLRGRSAERLAAHHEMLRELRRLPLRNVEANLFVPASADTGAARARLRDALGPRIVREFPAPKAPPMEYVVTDQAAMWIVVQPESAAASRGEDIAVRLAGPVFVAEARHRLASIVGS